MEAAASAHPTHAFPVRGERRAEGGNATPRAAPPITCVRRGWVGLWGGGVGSQAARRGGGVDGGQRTTAPMSAVGARDSLHNLLSPSAVTAVPLAPFTAADFAIGFFSFDAFFATCFFPTTHDCAAACPPGVLHWPVDKSRLMNDT